MSESSAETDKNIEMWKIKRVRNGGGNRVGFFEQTRISAVDQSAGISERSWHEYDQPYHAAKGPGVASCRGGVFHVAPIETMPAIRFPE